MHTDPVMEWRRLADHYRALGDEELQLLAFEFGDLTEMAQQSLRSELQSRGLGAPEAIVQAARNPAPMRGSTSPRRPSGEIPDQLADASADDDSAEDAETDGPQHDYTWKVLLCECSTGKYAWQLSQALRRAGIDSWVDGPGRYSPLGDLDTTNPRVLVAADQVEEARAVAAQPIPQDIVAESEEEPADYIAPNCPGCGAADPVLESADPVNAWHCEVCDREWTEAPAGGGSETGNSASGTSETAPATPAGRVKSFFGFGGS
jgi:hypothetical protein